MSTSDPGTSDRAPERTAPADQDSTALADHHGSAAMFTLSDPAVIARLANEFFSALRELASTSAKAAAPTKVVVANGSGNGVAHAAKRALGNGARSDDD